MSWLRAIPFLFTLLAFVLQPASASAFGAAHPEARVSAFELVALASVGASAETSPGLHEGIGRAYDENASGYRFAARGTVKEGEASALAKLARKLKLNPDSPTTRLLLDSANMTVVEFVGKYRKGKILGELPGEVLEQTVEQALRGGGSKVRKLLTDKRFEK